MLRRRLDRASKTFLSAIAGTSLLFGLTIAPHAAEPDASFKGQTVHLYIGFAPGGSYDYFGRLVARLIGRHLPGNPTVIAEQMPGAGSFTAANYLYARAPKDGTALGIVSQTMAIEEALGTPGVQYKAARFNWIGRATSVNEVSLTFHTSKTKTIRDAVAQETTMAGTGAGSPSETYLKLLNEVAGTRFKLVGPYPASNDSMLAMERGEVDGAFTSYATLKVSHQDWLRDNTINILVQYGERSADLPDIPYAVDLATTDEGRQLMAFYVSSEQIGVRSSRRRKRRPTGSQFCARPMTRPCGTRNFWPKSTNRIRNSVRCRATSCSGWWRQPRMCRPHLLRASAALSVSAGDAAQPFRHPAK
jgi:tripartite-type tricarboxylate transporter receptor subunit TctC